MSNPSTDDFYALSVVLTGYSEFELHGTGVGQTYFDTIKNAVSTDIFAELLTTYRDEVAAKAGDDEAKQEQLLRNAILSNEKLGPIARNLLKMWYVGNWYGLPDTWYARYFPSGYVLPDHVVSAEAYQEGLVWNAMETHPMGAKWPGYGTWGLPLDAK